MDSRFIYIESVKNYLDHGFKVISWRAVSSVLIVTLIIFAKLFALKRVDFFSGIDFYQYWIVAQGVSASEVKSLYQTGERERLGLRSLIQARAEGSAVQLKAAEFRRVPDLTSTPLLYAVMGLFPHSHFDRDLMLYRFIGLLLTVFSVFALLTLFNVPSAYRWPAVAATIAVFAPIDFDLRLGNVTFIQLALFTSALWLIHKSRFMPLGGLLILGVIFKPNLMFVPAVIFLLLLRRREWNALGRFTCGAFAGTGIALAITLMYYGSLSPWIEWCDLALPSVHYRPEFNSWAGNFSLSSLVNEKFAFKSDLVISAMVLPLLAFGGERRKNSADDHFLRLSLAVSASAFIPSLVWYQYYTLALPMVLILLLDSKRRHILILTALAAPFLVSPQLYSFNGVGLHMTTFSFLGLWSLGLFKLIVSR